MSELWVERHRPRSVSEMKGQRAVVDRLSAYSESKTFPHLMFADHLNRKRRPLLWH